jgi:hypothetical protein
VDSVDILSVKNINGAANKVKKRHVVQLLVALYCEQMRRVCYFTCIFGFFK